MTKFKFGDKVWHEEHGDGIYFKPGEKCSDYVIFKDDGYATKVESYDIIIVDDWVKCSERMPEFNVRVLVASGNHFDYDFLLNMETHTEWASYNGWEYWMYAPEMPEVKE